MVIELYNFIYGGVQMATFAERLKELRKEKQLTVEQLANNIGSAKSTISRYENGREPKGDIIRLLTEYFDVSIDYLMGVSDIKTPNLKNENKESKLSPEVETIAAHLKGKDITPKKMEKIKNYIDFIFSEFDDE
jgi:transcriptional regulator with XRE-family HTH domain